jgi:RNA-directed DNA polymerase
LWLANSIIDGSNPQEPVHVHYRGTDPLTPVRRRRGLRIGNLTSQLFANIYLCGFYHFYAEVLPANSYLRYVDDFVLFGNDPSVLEDWRQRIADYLVVRPYAMAPRQTIRDGGGAGLAIPAALAVPLTEACRTADLPYRACKPHIASV